MTHHNKLLEKLTSDRRVLESPAARCNGCGREANFWSELSEENFVQVKDKKLDGEDCYCLFCPDCLKNKNINKDDVRGIITFTGDENTGYSAGIVYPRDIPDETEDSIKEDTGLSEHLGSDETEVVESGTTVVEQPKKIIRNPFKKE